MSDEHIQVNVNEVSDAGWDAFVESRSDSSFFHLSVWSRVIEQTFRHRRYNLAAVVDGRVAGVFPMVLVHQPFGKKILVSMAFGVSGGVVAESEDVEAVLVRRAEELCREIGAEYIEIRTQRELAYSWERSHTHDNFLVELPGSEEELLESLKRKARGAVRKGMKSGLEARFERDRIEEFYKIYAASVRNLGSPVFPCSLMKHLVAHGGSSTDILCVFSGERAVAAVLTFFFKDTVIPYYGGSLKEHLDLSPNNFMYWELMRHGIQKGYRWFDFGRSRRGSGSYQFKLNWGFEPHPVYNYYYLNKRRAVPNLSTANPKFDLPRMLWSKLPQVLADWLGPKIVRYIP